MGTIMLKVSPRTAGPNSSRLPNHMENAINFANVGKIGWKERHTIHQINPRLFRHIIKKILIQFQDDMICIFIT
jgi:hypothetical protein